MHPARRRPRPGSVVSLVAAALVATSLAACSGGGGERVTIYSGRTENLVAPILARFAAETGIDVDVRYGQSADLALLIDEEGDRSPADVFLSQSPGAVSFLADEGRLRPLGQAVLDEVAPSARSAQGLWVGVSGRIRVLVYNTDMVRAADLPATVFDLVGPAYRGRVALAPSNGSFQDFVTGMRQSVGDDRTRSWLVGMRENGARTYANNTAIVEAVGRGEIAMGLVNHYYNARAKVENPSIRSENHVFPGGDLGAMNLVTGAAILESSANTGAAERLVRFLLEEEAQRYFADETFEYPLAQGVPPAAGLPPLDSINTPTFDSDTLGGGLSRTKELINESGLERV